MRRISCLLILLLATACSSPDPMQRVGTWQPQGSNDTNLRLMVANPEDLVIGRGATDSLGAEAGPPITRLFAGQRAPLPQVDASDVATSSPGIGPAQPAGPAPSPLN